MLTVGHFFAGGGGGILASEILGHESVFALEINERRCRVIKESGWFPKIHVECADIRRFNPEPWKGKMDCIAAGFPCQDISCAGTGHGLNGKRSGLVWELFRAIDVIQPSIVFLENSPRIRTKGRRELIKAFVERGYSWRDGTLAASHAGAGHLRNRWWCIAANDNGLRKLEQERRVAEQRGWFGNSFAEIADLNKSGRIGRARTLKKTEGWTEFADALKRAIAAGGMEGDCAASIAIAGAYTGIPN
jgi:DNA (cytosine-5)-methyltransferase 1